MREAIVTANKISVREGRGQNFLPLGTYSKGDKIIVLDSTLDENYVKVLWITGYAYCEYGQYIKFTDTSLKAEDITDTTLNAVVTANRISVRKDRTQSSEKLGEFVKNDKIVVLDNDLNQEYSKVIWKVGYAYCSYGKYIEYTAPPPQLPNAVVTSAKISVRKGRAESYEKIGEFYIGDRIKVLDSTLDYDYVHVAWKDADGYAYCNFGANISMINPNAAADIKKLLDIAKACVGGMYIYGAQGTKITQQYVEQRNKAVPQYFTNGRYEFFLNIGKQCDKSGVWVFPKDYAWDCSGLWWYSANKAGIYGKNKDSTADTFYNGYCMPVSKSELKAGDAVFYRSSSGRITHMAIVGENGVVYEAMSGYTGVVQDSSVDDRTAPKIVGSGNITRSAWNLFGRPKIFLT